MNHMDPQKSVYVIKNKQTKAQSCAFVKSHIAQLPIVNNLLNHLLHGWFHTKYLTHTMKDAISMQRWEYNGSQIYEHVWVSETLICLCDIISCWEISQRLIIKNSWITISDS